MPRTACVVPSDGTAQVVDEALGAQSPGASPFFPLTEVKARTTITIKPTVITTNVA